VLLAVTSEKLAEYGLVAPVENLLTYLPESSAKYRLKAVALSQNIDDIRTDYISHFPKVLDLLNIAANLEEQNYTRRIVQFLKYYFLKGSKALGQKNYSHELKHLKSLFNDPTTISKYPFVGHFEIEELIEGRFIDTLFVEGETPQILYASSIVQNHFKYNINQLVLSHEKSVGTHTLLGYDKSTILNDVLQRGKTAFDISYQTLDSDDKVLLYCYFNMKKHFFTSLAVFGKLWNALQHIIKNQAASFIDLGCGPLTSGLAFGDLFMTKTGKPIAFNYVGIDISNAMIKKAKEFAESDLFDDQTTFSFYKNWRDIEPATLEIIGMDNRPIFINASYVFANLSEAIVKDLASFINNLLKKFSNVHFIFQNPDRTDRNIGWETFKGQIKFQVIESRVEKVKYQTSTFREPSEEDVYYEILTLKK
jgi:SAM-dependent methyltransferase